ncbi:MAG: hypothetical protein E7638_01690 [Ruminococcaceae bacterium]|nr:hypothetical protein [Oscillospiraceae bacterium]
MYNYAHLDLSSLSAGSLGLVVWGICGGIIAGIFLSLIYKNITSSFIKTLVKKGISDEEKAVTLSEAEAKGKWYLRSALKSPYKPIRRYVICANEKDLLGFDPKEQDNIGKKADLPMDKAKFYLPEENRTKAEIRFSEAKRPAASFIFTAVLLIAAAYFSLYAAPELLQMLDNFIGTLKN